MSLPDSREEAHDALITASLHLHDRGPTEEELRAFLEDSCPLPDDKQKALDAFEPDLFGSARPADQRATPPPAEAAVEAADLYLAMNRKNADDVRSAETEAELERRRREALARLKPRPEPPPPENP